MKSIDIGKKETRIGSMLLSLIIITAIIPFSVIDINPKAEAAVVDPIDFNNDGFNDVCIGIPGEDVVVSGVNRVDAGAVNCIYGSAAGLTAAGNQFITQPAGAIPGGPEADDRFGWSLAAGNYNGDSFDDLCVGAPEEDIGVGPVVDAGLVNCFFGSSTGLVTSPGQVLTQNVGSIPDSGETNDNFGFSLASGNLNVDSFDDLCIGVPKEDLTIGGVAKVDNGAVHCLKGSATGLDTAAPGGVFLYQGAVIGGVAVAETAEDGDQFGFALGTGDWNNGSAIDLCIGVPLEDLPGDVDAGGVNCVSGIGGAAIISTGLLNLFITQDSVLGGVAIVDSAEADDKFGWALVGGDMNADGNADLCVGAPEEDIGAGPVVDAGAVNCIYGSASSLVGTGNQFINQNSIIGGIAILDVGEASDFFGRSLASADFGNDGDDDLCIGAPGENLTTGGVAKTDGGAVNCLYGTSSGLTGSGNQFWHQDVAGIEGGVEDFNLFGSSLTTGDFQGDGPHDLCVGVPGEDIGALAGAGAVNCIYGVAGVGLGAASDQIWYQDIAGIGDVSEAGDNYGASLDGDIVVTHAPGLEEDQGEEQGEVEPVQGEG